MAKCKQQPATTFENALDPDSAIQAAQVAPVADATQDASPAPAPDTGEPVATDASPAETTTATTSVEPAPRPRRQRSRRAATGPTMTTDAGPAPDPGAVAPEGSLTMAELSVKYIAALRDAGKGLGTQFSYSIDIAVAVRHFGPETQVASLTPRKVQNFFESDVVTKTRAGKAKAQPTIDKTRRVLRLALEWAAKEGLIPAAPLLEKPAA